MLCPSIAGGGEPLCSVRRRRLGRQRVGVFPANLRQFRIPEIRPPMSILIAINHKTEYRFDRPVGIAPHIVRLRPAPHCRTPIVSYSLRIEPREHFINWQQDPFGNYLARLVFPEKANTLSIEVDVIAEMITINPFDFFLEDSAQKIPLRYDAQLAKELGPYLEVKEDGPLTQGVAGRGGPHTDGDGRFPGCPQPASATGRGLCDPHGAWCADLRADPAYAQGLVPRHGLGAGADPSPSGVGGALRFRISRPAHLGRQVTRRPERTGTRLHRPACLGRGLHPRRRVDRARSDVGAVRRRGPHPARLHTRPGERRPHHRRRREKRRAVLLPQPGRAHPRGPARHQALHRGPVARHPGPRPRR